MKVVCNTTPIISLASIGQLPLLAGLFSLLLDGKVNRIPMLSTLES